MTTGQQYFVYLVIPEVSWQLLLIGLMPPTVYLILKEKEEVLKLLSFILSKATIE